MMRPPAQRAAGRRRKRKTATHFERPLDHAGGGYLRGAWLHVLRARAGEPPGTQSPVEGGGESVCFFVLTHPFVFGGRVVWTRGRESRFEGAQPRGEVLRQGELWKDTGANDAAE